MKQLKGKSNLKNVLTMKKRIISEPCTLCAFVLFREKESDATVEITLLGMTSIMMAFATSLIYFKRKRRETKSVVISLIQWFSHLVLSAEL